jgi:hypothetical protein
VVGRKFKAEQIILTSVKHDFIAKEDNVDGKMQDMQSSVNWIFKQYRQGVFQYQAFGAGPGNMQ